MVPPGAHHTSVVTYNFQLHLVAYEVANEVATAVATFRFYLQPHLQLLQPHMQLNATENCNVPLAGPLDYNRIN